MKSLSVISKNSNFWGPLSLLILLALLLPNVADSREQLVVYSSLSASDLKDPDIAREIASFEKQNDVSVQFVKRSELFTEDLHKAYLRILSAKSGAPDVIEIDGIRVPEFASMDYIADLTDSFSKSERAGFFEPSIKEVMWKDRIWAYPFYTAYGLILYRKDLVGKPPSTWQELIDTAKRLERPGLYGFVGQMALHEALTCNALEFMWSNGGDPDFESTKRIFSQKDVEALGLMIDVVRKYALTPPDQLNFRSFEGIQLAQEGRVLFLRHWPRAFFELVIQKSPYARAYAAMPIPRGPSGGHGYSTLGGWTLAVNRFSKNRFLAHKLLKFLTGDSFQKRMILKLYRPPVKRALYSDPDVLRAFPWMAEAPEIISQAKLRPRTLYYPEISKIMQDEIHLALEGKITSAQAAGRADEKIRAFLRAARTR